MIVGLRSNAFKSMSLNIRYLFYTHLFYFFYGCIYVLDEHYLFCGITMLPPPPVLDLSGPKMCWMKAKFSAVFLLSLIFVCVFKDDWSWYWKGPNHWNGVHHHRLWPEHFGGGNADQQEWCVSCCRLWRNSFSVSGKGPNLIIKQPDKLLDEMSDWCKEHHGKVSHCCWNKSNQYCVFGISNMFL